MACSDVLERFDDAVCTIDFLCNDLSELKRLMLKFKLKEKDKEDPYIRQIDEKMETMKKRNLLLRGEVMELKKRYDGLGCALEETRELKNEYKRSLHEVSDGLITVIEDEKAEWIMVKQDGKHR